MVFALIFEKLVFDNVGKRVFRWRPAAAGVEVVEEVFEAEAKPRVPVLQSGQ